MLNRMKIRTKILLALMLVLLPTFALMAFIIFANLGNITGFSRAVGSQMSADAISGTEEALIEQANSFLATLTDAQSKMANVVLQNIALNVTLIEGAVRDIYENPESFPGRDIMRPRDAVEGVYSSTWLLAEHLELTDDIQDEVAMLSNLAVIMPALADDPNILELYVGTEKGVFYNYTPMTFENPTYDPRVRPWYIEAAAHPGQVIFTEVYEDAFGTGMVLTAAQAIEDADGKLIGVAALDIQLDALKELVLDTRVVDTGYVFIIDKYGTYIVHPEMGGAGFKHFQDDDDVYFADGLRMMMEGYQGFTRAETEDGVMYLAFAPLEVADWSVGVVVPESEILSAKDSLALHMDGITTKATGEMDAMLGGMTRELAMALVISVLIVLVIGIILSQTISKPIRELTRDVSFFGGGAYDSRITVGGTDEIGILAGVFNQMADDIVKNIGEIATAAAERERIDGELRIAGQVQQDMLPDVTRSLVDCPGIEMYACVEPALEMGGDLYDVFFIDADSRKLCEVVADVSGHGMAAAMFMVMAKTLIRNFMLSGLDPAESLRQANMRLCEDNAGNMFVTVQISVTDLGSGECLWAQAGHNPVAYCPAGGQFDFIESEATSPLGFFPDSSYPLHVCRLSPGDMRFQYTDGVSEAIDAAYNEWGEAALLATLNENRHLSCVELVGRVQDSVARHRKGALQSDDITVLVTRYKEFAASAANFTVKNNLGELKRIFEELSQAALYFGISEGLKDKLGLCMDEIFSNIIKFAYDDDAEHVISLSFDVDALRGQFVISVVDDGKAFDPREARQPDLGPNLMEREIGGLGLFIVSNIVSSMEYRRLNGKNHLTLRKDIQ